MEKTFVLVVMGNCNDDGDGNGWSLLHVAALLLLQFKANSALS